MKEQTLIKWLKAGSSQFKEHNGIPSWLVPQRSFDVMADWLGDINIVESSPHLNLSTPDNQLHDIDRFPDETWRKACLEWPQLPLVKGVIISLFESIQHIVDKYDRGELTLEPNLVCRGLIVMSLAPFVPQGKNLLEAIAAIMHFNPEFPADIIRKYVSIVLTNDRLTVAKLDEFINSHREWADWVDLIQQQSESFNVDYRLVAVTPPHSDVLTSVLADMIKEGPSYGA
ncbi:hypothetical protein ACFLV5_00525 [Chloroflexota bacterium]